MENKKTVITIVTVLLGGIVLGYFFSTFRGTGNGPSPATNSSMKDSNKDASSMESNSRKNLSKQNCVADDCLAVENFEYPAGQLSEEAKKALIEAINDEYKAHTVYEKTIAKLGNVRPFSMIIRAEESHIASLKGLFDKYGVTIPANDWSSKVQSEKSLQEACKIGVEAEIANAKLYKEKLLPAAEGYEDIIQVFTNLMNASQDKHLPAFQRCD